MPNGPLVILLKGTDARRHQMSTLTRIQYASSNALYSIQARVAVLVLMAAMIDHPLLVPGHPAQMSARFVSVDGRARLDVLVNDGLQPSRVRKKGGHRRFKRSSPVVSIRL